jgi:hypothetical protein
VRVVCPPMKLPGRLSQVGIARDVVPMIYRHQYSLASPTS